MHIIFYFLGGGRRIRKSLLRNLGNTCEDNMGDVLRESGMKGTVSVLCQMAVFYSRVLLPN
jgi:hypothetical protein